MNRSDYHSGRYFTQNPMVNGNLYTQPAQPGLMQTPYYIPNVLYVRQHYPVVPSFPQHYAPQTYVTAPVAQPSTPLVQKIETSVKRPSKAVKIIDPATKVDVLEDFIKTKGSLRESAPEFVPSKQCLNIEDVQTTVNTETELPELKAQDTVVDLDETLEGEALNEGLSFDETEDNPSLTASIKQIPSNLEQKLNLDDEIQLTSNFKTTILPKKQESHSSLPDAFRDESSLKRIHYPYSNSPPSSHDFRDFDPRNFNTRIVNDNIQFQNNSNRFQRPMFRGQFQPQHRWQNNNNRNYHRTASERNLSTWKNPTSYHNNRTYTVNNNVDHQKVDQECTAYPIKNASQHSIVSEPEKLKETKYDENNNEITEDSVSQTELSLLETTGENSESSLNLSCRYSVEKLTKLMKSPLVLSNPPTIKGGLLDSSMNKSVWNLIFEENNSSLQNNNKHSHLKKGNINFRYDGNQNQLTRSKSVNEKQIIKMNLSIKEDVKLNKAENAWKPTHMKHPEAMDDKDRELAELVKNFRSLLNKITEENFDHLIKEINDKRKFMINSSEKLSAIIKLLFEKSISEPGYASTYAKLCHALSTVHLINEDVIAVSKKTSNPWKTSLITHCQQEFERTKTDDVTFKSLQDSINNATDTEEIENYEELYFKLRQRANGTVKFIGELYKINMLTAKIMMSCIEVLLTSVTEENIERLCKLLTTVGEKLESELNNKSYMDKYMLQLAKLKNSNVITTQRIKFDIMNVIDLRASRWRQRENARSLETKPQKLQDLQEQENKKKILMQQQLNDYQPRSNQNNQGRHRSQRNDNDGFRVYIPKQFDLNKINFSTTNNAEVSLGRANTYQGWHQNKVEPKQMQSEKTEIRNTFAKLPTDCDDIEPAPALHRTRSGSGSKNNRKDKKNGSQSHGNNNKEKAKARTPSPVIEKSADNDDDYFTIPLTDSEEKDIRTLTDKMQQANKGKITLDMLVTDLKKIKITKNILGQVFTNLFDKKSMERKELIELIGDICRKGLITKIVNIEALKLAIKSIPTIICDVPLAYDYFSEYCVYFYENGLITSMDEIESICQSQQNALNKIKKKIKASKINECKQTQDLKNTETVNDEISKDLKQSEPSVPVKIKNERCLQKTMKFIQFKLEKKQKNTSFLEEIYSEIDKEKCVEASNFIKDLTLAILKSCLETKGKKSQKKSVDMSKMFPLFVRYIDSDISSQIDCINALNEFAFSNSNIENCKLCKLFDLFYENDVISVEAFNMWRKQDPNSPSKREALNQTTSFFTRLEEADISDDFNCTSSTIKED